QRHVGEVVASGIRRMEAGNLLGAMPDFVEALRLDEDNPLRTNSYRLRIGSVLAYTPKLTQVSRLSQHIMDAGFTPDSEHILIPDFNGPAKLYDLNTSCVCMPAFGGLTNICSVDISQDGKLAAFAGERGTVFLWDIQAGKERPSIHLTN